MLQSNNDTKKLRYQQNYLSNIIKKEDMSTTIHGAGNKLSDLVVHLKRKFTSEGYDFQVMKFQQDAIVQVRKTLAAVARLWVN